MTSTDATPPRKPFHIKVKPLPPLEKLREELDYDPDTGVFRWKKSRGRVFKGSVAGRLKEDGYRVIGLFGGEHLAHRLGWFYFYGKETDQCLDHINGGHDDNWIANLREASHAENLRNRGANRNNKTGLVGVSFDRQNRKFLAQISLQGKNTNLGRFATAELAAEAYQAAAKQHLGVFHRIPTEAIQEPSIALGPVAVQPPLPLEASSQTPEG